MGCALIINGLLWYTHQFCRNRTDKVLDSPLKEGDLLCKDGFLADPTIFFSLGRTINMNSKSSNLPMIASEF